jgi:DNA-binding PadR family transcriptional regulator
MQKLLQGWELQFKKGQLALWLLLSLVDGDKSTKQIHAFIDEVTTSRHSFEDQSLYRTLRKFTDLGLIVFTEQRSSLGPNTKLFTITPEGRELLGQFIDRNISLFNQAKFNSLVKKI